MSFLSAFYPQLPLHSLEEMNMKTEFEKRCSNALRELRRQKGYTLHECESLTKGKFKAVVLGSYERGTRAISLAKLVQLAEFYEVPVDHFFAENKVASDFEAGRLVFDIRKIRARTFLDETLDPLKRYLNGIASKRSDWNGEVISLRKSDSEILAFATDMTFHELRERLILEGLLFR